jgi:uncharacterized protein
MQRVVQPVVQRVVWFDVPVKDLARAKTFYEAVLQWKVKEEYPGVGVFEHDHSSLGGCLTVDASFQPSEHGAFLYYNVTGRHEEAEVLATRHGGKVLTPKHPIGPFGLHSEPEVA